MNKKYFFRIWSLCSFLIFLFLRLSLLRYRQKEKWAKKTVEGWRKKYHPFDDNASDFL